MDVSVSSPKALKPDGPMSTQMKSANRQLMRAAILCSITLLTLAYANSRKRMKDKGHRQKYENVPIVIEYMGSE